MGLFDSVAGALGQGAGGGGSQAALLQEVVKMLSSGDGLAGLVQKFQQGGLGDIVAGWISNGPNPPVSAEQLRGVLGPDMMSGLAAKLGMNPAELAGPLAQLLPGLVDKMTPEGRLPAPGAAPDLGSLLGGLLGGTPGR